MQTCACVPHPLRVDLRSRDKVTTPHFCVPDAMTQFSGWCSYCGPEDSHNVTQGVTWEPSQAILFLFFFFSVHDVQEQKAGGDVSKPLPVVCCCCSVCLASRFVADLGVLRIF